MRPTAAAMGNADSKQGKTTRRIPADEARKLASCLGVKSESDLLSQEKVCQSLSWNGISNPVPLKIWKSISRGSSNTKFSNVLDLVDAVYQDPGYASKYIVNLLDTPLLDSAAEYTLHLIKLFNTFHTAAGDSWRRNGVIPSDETAQLLADKIVLSLQSLTNDDNEELIMSWLQREPLLYALQRSVLCSLFKLSSSSIPEIIPLLTCQLSLKPKSSILDIYDIMFLNDSLPHDLQSEWSLLFSTRIHGLSFTSMLGKIMSKGPTLLIIEDTKGHVFGGFASDSWRLGPKFLGNGKCFLFKLHPFMAAYTATGYNDHHMYLNHQQQTMPNGLGMGGQLGHFGFWIDADFGTGHTSEGCSTYHRVPTLSAEKEFNIEHLEVWAVGPPPKEESDDETDGNKRSILDKDSGAKAMLEMIDRGHHSEGLREVPEETY